MDRATLTAIIKDQLTPQKLEQLVMELDPDILMIAAEVHNEGLTAGDIQALPIRLDQTHVEKFNSLLAVYLTHN